MDFREKLLNLNRIVENDDEIEDIIFSVLIKYQMFEPCRYSGEDDEWLDFLILPTEDTLPAQPMSVKKSEIISIGVINDIDALANFDFEGVKMDSDGLYQ